MIDGVTGFLSRAVAARKKIQDGEPLDESDVAIIDIALAPIIQEPRTPFQRFRDHFIIGTERFKLYAGLDFYNTILIPL